MNSLKDIEKDLKEYKTHFDSKLLYFSIEYLNLSIVFEKVNNGLTKSILSLKDENGDIIKGEYLNSNPLIWNIDKFILDNDIFKMEKFKEIQEDIKNKKIDINSQVAIDEIYLLQQSKEGFYRNDKGDFIFVNEETNNEFDKQCKERAEDILFFESVSKEDPLYENTFKDYYQSLKSSMFLLNDVISERMKEKKLTEEIEEKLKLMNNKNNSLKNKI